MDACDRVSDSTLRCLLIWVPLDEQLLPCHLTPCSHCQSSSLIAAFWLLRNEHAERQAVSVQCTDMTGEA